MILPRNATSLLLPAISMGVAAIGLMLRTDSPMGDAILVFSLGVMFASLLVAGAHMLFGLHIRFWSNIPRLVFWTGVISICPLAITFRSNLHPDDAMMLRGASWLMITGPVTYWFFRARRQVEMALLNGQGRRADKWMRQTAMFRNVAALSIGLGVLFTIFG